MLRPDNMKQQIQAEHAPAHTEQTSTKQRHWHPWQIHLAALLVYALLSLLLSWPLALNFTTHITGHGEDPLHNLWIYWHTKEVFQGEQPLFYAPDLYYPKGISLLIHGLGPAVGTLALPFWAWGPEAAHNGAILVSLWLTGYTMFLLARGLGFDADIALFAGVTLMAAPLCLAGMFGTITKVFLVPLPLALLAIHHALDVQKSVWWSVAPALTLLLALLHNGYQFVYAAMGIGFFALALWLAAARDVRRAVFVRGVWVALAALALAGPLVLATLLTARDPSLQINVSGASSLDAALLFMPPYFSQVYGDLGTTLLDYYNENADIERTISLSWVGIALCIIGLFGQQKYGSRRWALFTLICVVFALGATLRLFGLRTFYDMTVPMPTALLHALPGLGFMRSSGRFMMIGYVAFGITASFGLARLVQHWPQQRRLLVLLASCLVLLWSWPRPFPQTPLPPVPAFYQQIASDPERYGVFDWPVMPQRYPHTYVIASAPYQILHMTHQKGIAGGYISRTYIRHPLFPDLMRSVPEPMLPDLFLNGHPTFVYNYHNMRHTLAQHNYRYLVWHKTIHHHPEAGTLLEAVFYDQNPLVDNDLVRVYAIDPAAPEQVAVTFGRNWYRFEESSRWATSPATLRVHAPQQQPALLHITPATLYDPQQDNNLGSRGMLDIQAGETHSTTAELLVNRTTTLPLLLPAGNQTITLTLQAGNFRPADAGAADHRRLSFAIRSVHLQTMDTFTLPDDIQVNGQPQQPADRQSPDLAAVYNTNWFGIDPAVQGRWASSPATLYIYSATAQPAQITTTLTALDIPAALQSTAVTCSLAVNATEPVPYAGEIGQAMTIAAPLDAGWNNLVLRCQADGQPLSFALADTQIVTP